jgi:hypothetical protein
MDGVHTFSDEIGVNPVFTDNNQINLLALALLQSTFVCFNGTSDGYATK